CPDIGIFASLDPVSIDKASVDMINKVSGKDVFRQVHPKRDWSIQLKYAEGLGIGNLDYQLVEYKI
ncbi:MAG: 4Fe-4S ferredoxin, partial [Candidatus Omnitrophica bacterium]|nr:4Fe-4S ferredoxin [Candidatus Omnitrophota bacterium]